MKRIYLMLLPFLMVAGMAGCSEVVDNENGKLSRRYVGVWKSDFMPKVGGASTLQLVVRHNGNIDINVSFSYFESVSLRDQTPTWAENAFVWSGWGWGTLNVEFASEREGLFSWVLGQNWTPASGKLVKQ